MKQGDQIIGNRVKVKVVKNKVAPPFRSIEFDIFYNEGIALMDDLLDTGVLRGVIKKSGNSFSYDEKKLGVGHDTAVKALKADPKLALEIRQRIIAQEPKI